MFDKTLPIGSVVLLQNANKRILVTGHQKYMLGKEDKIYDYIGVPYPEGYIAADKMVLFDHEQIKYIFALGFQNLEQFEYQEKLKLQIENGK